MRILVPLDGTDLSTSILPDACRLAGAGGEIVLVRDASLIENAAWGPDPSLLYEQHYSREDASDYLQTVADTLEGTAVSVRAQPLVMGDPAFAIDEAAKIFQVDMIACATHGRGMLGRLVWGSVARRALVHSPVPVLLRHAEDGKAAAAVPEPLERRIMVPLDGSPLGEKAVPLAQQLATQWQAEIRLVHVVPYQWVRPTEEFNALDPSDARSGPQDDMVVYLRRIAEGLQGKMSARVLSGPVVERLAAAAEEWAVTDIVMSSHGRTGLSRVILGSVADSLVQRLRCPIVIVPALSVQTVKVSEQMQEGERTAAV